MAYHHENPADTRILFVLHCCATDNPVIISEVIGCLLRFENTQNKGEFPYNIVIECSDEQYGIKKEGKEEGTENFNVREVMEWLLPFMTK
jgi:hypothetical protein